MEKVLGTIPVPRTLSVHWEWTGQSAG